MTEAHRKFPSALEDALYAFAIAPDGPTADALDVLTRRFPMHAEELTDIAVDLALEALADNDNAVAISEATSSAVSRAMSNFNNRLHEINTIKGGLETKSAIPIESPFSSLGREEIRGLAKQLDVNTLFVIKLRDHVIVPNTISAGFTRALAGAMRQSVDTITAFFAAEPRIAQHAHYKAEQKPTAARQQTFEEAVRTSNLSAEQQSRLLSL